MIFPRPQHNFQILKVGLVILTTGLAGFALWNNAFTAPSPIAPLAEIYPTSIPWLQDQATCEKTDRSWHSEQCWDSQHDPSF